MIGLNVTRQVLATRDRRDRIRSMGRTTTTHVADMLDIYAHGEGSSAGASGHRLERLADLRLPTQPLGSVEVVQELLLDA